MLLPTFIKSLRFFFHKQKNITIQNYVSFLIIQVCIYSLIVNINAVNYYLNVCNNINIKKKVRV